MDVVVGMRSDYEGIGQGQIRTSQNTHRKVLYSQCLKTIQRHIKGRVYFLRVLVIVGVYG